MSSLSIKTVVARVPDYDSREKAKTNFEDSIHGKAKPTPIVYRIRACCDA
jgi:hypothetical protein